MHPRELIEFGAQIALTAPRSVREAIRLSPTGLNDYWIASRQRFDAWVLDLTPFWPTATAPPVSRAAWTNRLRPLLEEIFSGELLARVWTAVGISHARGSGHTDCEPVLRGVLLNHVEIRNRALNCLVYGRGPESSQIVELQQVRRRVERWTDCLFGEMQREIDVAEFAHNPRRARDYALTSRAGFSATNHPSKLLTDDGLLESLRTSFVNSLSPVTSHAQLNEKIAASVLGCFQGDWLDSLKWAPRQWLTRLTHASNDSLLWINDILNLDTPQARREPVRRQEARDNSRDA